MEREEEGRLGGHYLEGEDQKRHTWLLVNQNAQFQDVTVESNILAVRGQYPVQVGRPNWVVVFADIDNDGDSDTCIMIPTNERYG